MSVFRRMFGPSKDEVWGQLAQEIGANMEPGGAWKGTRVEAHAGEWTVTLDTHTVSTGKSVIIFTRLRAPYVNADGFRFKIYRHGFFSNVGKMLGGQDITIGEEPFDTDFVIKGNDEAKVRELFSNPRLRELISAQPEMKLEVKDDEGWFGSKFPEGVDELCYEVTGVIKDVPRLKALFDLFGETLHQLCHIGSAYEQDPNVTLK